MDTKIKKKKLKKRIRSTKKKVLGSPERPRLLVKKSLTNIYAQIVDDTAGKVLAAASSLSPELAKDLQKKNKVEKAKVVGKRVAEKVLDKGIKTVVFDKHGYKYHGRVKALADGAREAGLIF